MSGDIAIDQLPGRDQQTAEFLDSEHIKWRYDPSFQLGAVSERETVKLQARLETFDQDTLERYTRAYKDPAEAARFPAIIVRKLPRKYVTLSGLHRSEAASRAGRKTHPAFIIQCEDAMAVTITVADNMKHGMNLSVDDRLKHAVHFVDMGWAQGTAARFCGLTQAQVSREMTAQRSNRRALDLELPDKKFRKLNAQTRADLMQLGNDPAFAEMAKLAIKAEAVIGSAAIRNVIGDVKVHRNEKDQLKAIATAAADIAPELQRNAGKGNPRGKVVKPAVVTLLSTLSNLSPIKAEDVKASISTPNQRANVRKEIDAAIRKLNLIKGKI